MNSVRPGPGDGLPRPGEVVAGKYRIESPIGAGGMGVVLGALDTSLGRPVAIKFLSPTRARREGTVPRFLREARAAASIQSEHVCRVHEVGTLPEGSPFIVMELLRGGDLAQVVTARGPLPIDEAVDHLIQACEALGEAHGLGIVHRDLKPQNLFVTQRPDGSPCVKVLDFGISKAIDEEAPNLTSTDTVMGTPRYMSPEQVRSLKNVDHRSDIWALGAILFELLTASPVFDAPTATALCAMIAMDAPVPLRRRRPDAPPELEAVILRCLHKDAAGRYPDVAALAEALAPFASERGRQSAMRVARVVRPSGPQLPNMVGMPQGPNAYASTAPASTGGASTGGFPGFGTTGGFTGSTGPGGPGVTGDPAQRPSYLPPAVGHSGYPSPMMTPSAYPAAPASHPTTQSAWQHQTGAMPARAQKSSAGPVIAIVGLVAGVGLIAVAGGGAYYLMHREPADDAKLASAEADAAAAPLETAAAVAAPAPTTSVAVATAKKPATAAGDPLATKPATTPAAAKDAGAAPAPTATPTATASKEDELEAQKRAANAQCNHMRFLLSTNDRANNNQARQVKTLTCLRASSPQGVTCERSVCRQACTILDDKTCLLQLDNAERSFPPRF
ncbi:MAG: protein kinase [Labilithrix sp.]|nr:protein kinase [Labilithrix sp.]